MGRGRGRLPLWLDGTWTRSSDIDVGVLFKPGLDEEGRVLARIDIAQSLQERA